MRQWIILCILLIVPALALQEDFQIYPSETTLNVCACELRQFPLLVQNTGDVPNSFQLFKSGTAADWITLSDGGFSLASTEQREVTEFLKVPCGIGGIYAATVSVQSQFGTVRQAVQEFRVQQCAELNVVPLSTLQQQSCPCTPTAFSFELENNGNAAEIYELSVSPLQYVTISNARPMLMPGERVTITLFVHSPCEVFGTREFVLKIQAKQSGLVATQPFSLEVNACYEYQVQVPSTISLCKNAIENVPVTLINRADFFNAYALQLQGPSWATIDPAWLPLKSGEVGKSTLRLNPGSTEAGSYPARIGAVSERGEVLQSSPTVLNLENCYETALLPQAYGPLVACEATDFNILVQNVGTRSSEVQLSLEGPLFAQLDQQRVNLEPNEARIVQEHLSVPCDGESFATELTAVATPLPEVQTHLRAEFRVISGAEAYALRIGARNIRTQYASRDFAIELQNTGSREATYRLDVVGPEFVAMSSTEIHLAPKQQAEILLNLAPPTDVPEGDYPFTITATVVEPDRQDIQFESTAVIRLRSTSPIIQALPWILGLLVLLALIGALSLKSRPGIARIAPLFEKRKPLIREPQVPKERPTVVSRISALRKVTEQPAKQFPDQRAPVQIRIKPWMWKVLILIGLILLAGIGTYFASPVLKEAFTPEAIPEPVVQIGATSLQVLPGNIVIIREPVQLPLHLINRETAETYDISTAAPRWVTGAERMALAPGQERSLTLSIDPSDVPIDDYPVTFTIARRSGGSTEEQITLRVARIETWQWIVFAIVLILVVGAVLILLLWDRIRMVRAKRVKLPKMRRAPISLRRIATDKIQAFRFARIAPYFIPTKGVLQRTRERASRFGWRRWMLLLVPLAIILLLLIVGLTTPLFARTASVVQEGYESMAERIKAVKPAEIDLFAERLPDEIYLDEDGVIIPLRIRNDDPAASYLISVREDIDWISADKTVLDIEPQSSGTVNIAVAPNAGVREGKYKITVGVSLEGGATLFDRAVVLNYQKKLWKKALLWLLLLLLALVMLAILIMLLQRKELERLHRKEAEVKL